MGSTFKSYNATERLRAYQLDLSRCSYAYNLEFSLTPATCSIKCSKELASIFLGQLTYVEMSGQLANVRESIVGFRILK